MFNCPFPWWEKTWICKGCTGAQQRFLVIASKKVIAAGYSVSICRSNCGQMLLHLASLQEVALCVFLQLMPSTVCLCSRAGASQKSGASGYAHTTAQKELQALLVYILATVCTCMKKFLGSAVWQQFEPLMVWWILESLNNFEPPGRIVCWEWCMGLWKAKHFCKAQLCTQKVQHILWIFYMYCLHIWSRTSPLCCTTFDPGSLYGVHALSVPEVPYVNCGVFGVQSFAFDWDWASDH